MGIWGGRYVAWAMAVPMITLSGFAFGAAVPNLPLSSIYEKEIRRLSPEQQAAMMMMIGIKGKGVTAETKKWVQTRRVGGIILFPSNIATTSQISNFTRDLRQLTPEFPLLIAVDQEGGRVRRIRQDVTFLPSAMTLGATDTPSLSYLSGMVSAKELFSLGINVNLAPVLDLYSGRQDALIGTRSFGTNPHEVAQLGQAYIHAHQLHGVSATAKHFPGHGEASGDSHFTLPESQLSLEEWNKTHRLPFQEAIERGVHLMMTAHVRFPHMLRDLGAPSEEQDLPAGFSSFLLGKLLRDEMKFRGLIVSDDLEMYAIRKKWSLGEAAVRAVLAGTDLVMIVWTDAVKEEVLRALTQAIRSGRITQARVEESLQRILQLRREKSLFVSEDALASRKNPFHQQTAQLIRKLGLTSFKPERVNSKENETITYHGTHADLLNIFSALLTKKKMRHFSRNGFELSTNVTNASTSSELRLFLLRNNADRRALTKSWSRWIQWSRQNKQPLGVVSMDSPRLLIGFENADVLLCTFNNDALSLASLASFFKDPREIRPVLASLQEFQ